MSSSVDQIKARLHIQDVVGSYVKLEKAGVNLKARCPFHNEKTPSFFVSPARESYYCFGCNKGGDIFNFVQDVEGIDFRSALTMLAGRAGVILSNLPEPKNDRLKILREIMDAATLFYERELAENSEVATYLLGRGLTKESIAKFRVGFAPDAWKKCYDFLSARGYDAKDISATGLIVEGKQGSYYDRFRQRVMFPIADSFGRIVAFTGRIFETKEPSHTVGDINTQGKYVNSPQTALYNKSFILYGLDKAKLEIRRAEEVVLVEGQFDLIMSQQAGLVNTVAVSGTALTREHLEQLKRLAQRIVLAFDSDDAGLASSRRAVEMAFEMELDVQVVPIVGGKDPADIVRESGELWKKMVTGRVHVVDFEIARIKSHYKEDRERRLAAEKDVLPLVARIHSAIDQAHFVKRVSDAILLPEEIIWKGIAGLKTPQSNANTIQPPKEAKQLLSRIDTLSKTLFGILYWQSALEKKEIEVAELERSMRELLGEKYEEESLKFEAEKDKMIFETENYYSGAENLFKTVDEMQETLESELLKQKYSDLVIRLQRGTNETETRVILNECKTIGERLEILKQKT